ncbi:hypothetical protein GCM10010346_64130 [Streptomyces chryseus]|uniref:Uncharacterized protein n=1 Tax=Streptomyces chryseus TaxID=68186 RepID=A0ABQ3EGW2_9ACTN|nr:hypothetical protein GCM10010346_64130 [Streptomyces chryseus]
MNEAVRVDVPDRGFSFPVAVRQLGTLASAARGGQFPQHAGRDLRLVGSGGVYEGVVHLGQPVRDALGQNLLQFQQRRQRGLVAAESTAERGLAQSDSNGECFFVIEDQRRCPGSGAETVTAPWSRVGLDGVAEFPELGDVPPHRAVGDRHSVGQLAAGPRRLGGKQGDQSQQAGGCADHVSECST